MSKRKKRIVWVVLGLVVATLVYMHWPMERVTIEVGPETTVLERPLHPDGTVNYVAAMDEAYAAGVTAENNAAEGLLRALGPGLLQSATRQPELARLGLSSDEIGEGLYQPWQPDAATADGATFTDPKGERRPLSQADLSDLVWLLRQGQVHPDLEAWLARNEAALDLIGQTAAERPRLYLPLVSQSQPPAVLDVNLPSLARLREGARALLVRAHWRALRGDRPGAWADLLATHRLARLADQGPTLIHRLVGMAIESLAAEGAIHLATQPPFDAGAARRHLAAIEALPPLQPLTEIVDRSERFMALDAIAGFSRGQRPGAIAPSGPVVGPGADWNAMLRRTNDWYDRMAAGFRSAESGSSLQAATDLGAMVNRLRAGAPSKARLIGLRLTGRLGRPALSGEIADFFMGTMLPSLDKALLHLEVAHMKRAVETTALALAAYRAETGRWPESLAALTGDLLPAVPVDAFTGEPLIYRPRDDGYLLYSVGMGATDDTGLGDDIAARVPHAPR